MHCEGGEKHSSIHTLNLLTWNRVHHERHKWIHNKCQVDITAKTPTKNEQTNDDKITYRLIQIFSLSLSLWEFFSVCRRIAKLNELYREQCSVSMTSINFNENMSSNKIVIIYFKMTCQFERFEYAFRFASFGILCWIHAWKIGKSEPNFNG